MDFTINLGSAVLNIVDIIILGIALVAGIAGGFEGFAKSFASKAAVLIGLIAGLMFSEMASDLVFSRLQLPLILNSLFSYMLCFIIGYIITLALGNMLSTAFDGIGLGPINSLLGFIWAVLFTLAICALILMLLTYQHLFDLSSYINNSFMFEKVFSPIIPIAEDFISNVQ